MRNKVLFKQGALWRNCLAYVKHMLSIFWTSLQPQGKVRVASGLTERQPRDNREMSGSGLRVAHEWLKYAAMFVMLLTIGVGNAWGTNASHTCSGTSGTIVTSKITWAATSATWYSPQCRIAANGTVVFTLTGVNVTSIVMGFSSSSYVGTWSSSGGGSFSTSSSNVTWTGTAGAGTLTFTTTAAARLKTITVTYTDAASYTITAQSNNTSYGTVSLSGSVITGSPKAGYTYGSPAYSVSPANSATVSQAGNAFTVTPSANTTVTINFVARTAASITFVNPGTPAPTTSGYYVGDSYTLPSTNNYSCSGGKTFVGWSTVEVATTNTKPTSNFYEPGASVTLAASQTFYAVFASVTEGVGDWEQCTSSTIAEGDYLIVQSDYMMTNTLNSYRFDKTYISITAGVISYDAKADWTAYTWHITETSTSGIFTIKNGSNYVIGNGTKSQIDLVASPTDNKELFAITYQSTPETYKIESKYNESQSVNRWLRNGGSYFACYADGGYPYLFKRGNGYGGYSTDCCNPLGSINGSINMSSSTDGTVTISDWTYAAGSTGTTESNVSSYTVKLYKLTGTSPDAWTIVSGSTSGGSSGTQGTRTGIATNSKSVTYSGLEYGATYKFTVTAIGTGSYCDGPETAVTSINSNALTNNKFLNKYSIYIDDATNDNYAHNYISSISSHAGSVDITLLANKDYYQYKLTLGGVVWWGNTGKMTSANCTSWTFTDGASNCKLQTNLGGTYTFALAAGTPAISVTYPPDDQASGKNIYFDNSILEWSNLFYRVGSGSTNVKEDFTLVAGTDNFYYTTTPEKNDISAWHIANNTGWTGSNDIYKTKTGDDYAITKSIAFQQYVVTGHMTIIPTTTSSKGSEDKNNNCDFYTINTPTSGMLTHTATITAPSHGTITISNTDQSLSATSTTANLPHRTILTITATPATGYTCTALTVNGAAFTSGSTHILAADATIAATFTANKYDVTLKPTSQTGSVADQVVQATYDAAMPTTVKTAGTAIVIPERTGYSFTGWFDNSSGGKQYYQYTGSPKTLSSANAWDKTSATNLYAQWSINSYTLTWATVRGKVTTAGTGADVNATGNVSSSQEYNTALTAPVCGSANGYTFTGWSPTPDSYMPAENTTYTAQWSANVYTVTLDNQSATTAGAASVSATFGQAMPSIASNLPAKTGYRFDGYYTAKNGGGTKYYNADGSSATNMAMYSANPKLYANWVAQLTFSVNGAIEGTLTRDVTGNLPSSADVPPACGDCWAFAGWDASSTCSTTPGHAGGENAATHGITTPTTLYAVFGMAEYELIRATSDLEADAYYVLTTLDIDGYEYALKAVLSGNYGTSTDIASQIKEKNSWYYLYNPSSNLVWKFTGNSSSGRLYSESLSKYMDLTGSGSLYKDATSDYLSFSIPDPTYVEFNIASTTTTTQKLHIYNDTEWGPTSSATGIYIYKRQSATYATEPSCETYDIVWKVNGTPTSAGGPTDETNTCAGIETLPTDPANNTLACANVFMGWSEEDLSGPDNEEPDDLFWRSGDAPKITGDKIFNAVFATGTPVDNTYKLTSLSNIKDGQIVLIVNHASNVACTNTASGSQLTAFAVSPLEETITTSETSIRWTVTKDGDYYIFKSGDNYLRSSAESNLSCVATSDKWSISSGSVSGTYLMTSYTSSKNFEYYNSKFTTYKTTGTAYDVDFYVQAMTYSDYMTNCCTAYTISGASKNGTDVIVSGNTGGTLTSNYNRACAEASVTLSATINPGYAFGGWTITGATSGDLTSTLLPGDNATSLTPAAFEMPGENITVSATITEKTATAWTWTYKSGAIPNPLVMYVNEYHQLDVTYVPSDLLDGQKNYAVTKESSVAQVSKQLSYYKMRGAVSVTSATSSTVTFTLGGLRQDVNVTVKPLPIVTFVDIVHNKTDFANAGSGYTAATGVLTSTVSDGVVTHTQPTPTHSKLDVPGSGNDCELTHLVLIGWIRSDCPDVDNYMRGLGAKPGNAAITGAGNDGEGRAYFVSAGADIDVEDYNTLTFYAVWAKVE